MCCLGPSLAGNPTQYVMEKCFDQANWDSRFLSLKVATEDLSSAIDGMRALNFCGAVIAGPYQTEVVPYIEDISPDADKIGAVNCLYRTTAGDWSGANTVGSGFLNALNNVFDPSGCNVLLMHTGSTARAIALALGQASVNKITIAGHEQDSGSKLVDFLKEACESSIEFVEWEGALAVEQDVQLVIHASEPGAVDPSEEVALMTETLDSDMLLADTCLGSPTTAFLRSGLTHGCRVLQGQQLLVSQWVECVRLWKGTEPDGDVMREALEEYLGL